MKNIILFLLGILFLGACKSPDYLSKPMDFSHHVKGLILKAEIDGKSKILGEIIEVNSEAIMILPIDKNTNTIMTIPKDKIQNADIIIASTSDNPTGISTWAGLINLAPAGHGWFMILSVPINLVTTISIGSDAAKGTYRMKYPKNVSWNQMSKFARFPQGIPDHINLDQIE
ncbi:MAG: hypothetical protein NXI23_24800 [Bacteroidetes bacterium]|jgi:hypothetical protein|nr:hypothetical protein [Bacteroidota bacterium]